MGPINFLRLIRNIYGKGLPDIEMIESMGLLAVKIGQVHALRVDFLNEEKCRELSKLYRRTRHKEGKEVVNLLDSLAPNLKEQLSYFEEKPFASASVGQVHRGILKNGEEVAIKIIKSDEKKNFERDVKSVKLLFKIAMFFYPKLKGVANPIQLLNQIEKMTLSELDLRNEVKGYEELLNIYDENKNSFDLSDLKFNILYKEFCGEKVLVSKFIKGKTLDEMMENKELTYEKLLKFFYVNGLFMYSKGVFHGDIHPGNIMIDEGRFVFVDTGFIGRVSDKMRQNLFHFFEHLCYYDYEQAAYYLNKMAEKEISGKEFEKFQKDMIELYKDFSGKPVGEMSLTKKMMQTIKLGVLSGMNFGEGIFDIIKSHMYLDGMVLRVKPQAVLLEDMRSFIEEFKNRV